MTFPRKKGKVLGLFHFFVFHILFLNCIYYLHLYAMSNFSISLYLRYSNRFFRAAHPCLILGSNDNDIFTFLSWVLENSI